MSAASQYGAVTAKVRALYGQRLTRRDYEEISALPGLPEVAVWLQKHPSWSGSLVGLDLHSVHRGPLEAALRAHALRRYERFCLYLSAVDGRLLRFARHRAELNELLAWLRAAQSGRPQEYVCQLTRGAGCVEFDPSRLTGMVEFSALRGILEGTRFVSALFRLPLGGNGLPNYTAVDMLLETHYFRTLFEHIRKNYSGSVQDGLVELFGVQVDLLNLARATRLRRFYTGDTAEIYRHLLPFSRHLPTGVMQDYLAADDVAGRRAVVGRSHYAKLFAVAQHDRPEMYFDHYLLLYCVHRIRLSPPSAIIPMLYLFLSDLETRNLIHAVESVRYGLAPEKSLRYVVTVGG